MATVSATRIRSMYRRHTQAYEAVYHFSANSVGHSIAGFSAARATRNVTVAICRRAFPRRPPPRDGEGRTGLIHRFAPHLNFN